MPAPLSDEIQNDVAREVAFAIRKAHPGVDGDLESHLLVAFALRQYARYAAGADRGFGPDHERTRAYLDLATSLAIPIGEKIERTVMDAIANQTDED